MTLKQTIRYHSSGRPISANQVCDTFGRFGMTSEVVYDSDFGLRAMVGNLMVVTVCLVASLNSQGVRAEELSDFPQD